MAKIRLQYASTDDKAGADDRVARSYAAMEWQMAEEAAKKANTDDTVPAPTLGSAMLDYVRNVDPSPSLRDFKAIREHRASLLADADQIPPAPIVPKSAKEAYAASAAERAEYVSAIYSSEKVAAKVDADALAAERMEAELVERFHAPTKTAATRIRAVEGLQRDLEKRTILEWRSATAIQRLVRKWLKKLRTDETVRYNVQYRKGEAQKRLYAKKEIATKERLQKEANRAEIADLAAPVRATKELLEAQAEGLEAQVRHRVPVADVRNISTRARDGQVVKLMESQLADREKAEAAELRTLSLGKFLTAKERLRLQKEEQLQAEEFEKYQTVTATMALKVQNY
eukprot:GDKJ01002654.1.p1 GENE.GDKJ01002654.1~~GDKJ01002654.1.p1  ORF type:complete len:400 (-),score=12.55 GDKJ01002654.1:76-1104(-)